MTKENRQLLATGQAAELCSVKPDTIRKWIKRGRLKTVRTAGGHHRIALAELAPYITRRGCVESEASQQNRSSVQRLRCWEYLSDRGTIREECLRCVVYRIRAAWCFSVATMEQELGHSRKFCTASCQDCMYYQRVRADTTNIIVISPAGRRLVETTGGQTEDLELRFATNAYEASAMVNDFRPAFVILDQAADGLESGLLESLARDPRIFGLKVILARPRGNAGVKKGVPADLIDGELEVPFTISQLRDALSAFPVEPLQEADPLP